MGYPSAVRFDEVASYCETHIGNFKNASLLELGDQTLLLTEADLKRLEVFLQKYGAGNKIERYRRRVGQRIWVSDVYEDIGVDYYCADLSGKNKAIPVDLNFFPNPLLTKEYLQRFDFVTNFGTTEHVGNQLSAFAILHYLSKPGGLILYHIPMLHFSNHALSVITPKFLKKLIDWNGYEILTSQWNSHLVNQAITFHYDSGLCFLDNFRRVLMESTHAVIGLIVLRNVHGGSFVPPLDVDVTGDAEANLLRKYISLFAHPDLNANEEAALERVLLGPRQTETWLAKRGSETLYQGRKAYLANEIDPKLKVRQREGTAHFYQVTT